MNKYLKPGVAVDVRGASDEVKERVMAAFVGSGAERINQCDAISAMYACLDLGGVAWFSESSIGELITIEQALGRDGEVEKNDWTNLGYAGEIPKVDQKCEYIDSSMTRFSRCKYIGVNSVGSKKFAVLFLPSVGEYVESKIGSELKFRPIKTEKEKFVDDLVLLMNDNTNSTFTEIAGFIYDSGYRKAE